MIRTSLKRYIKRPMALVAAMVLLTAVSAWAITTRDSSPETSGGSPTSQTGQPENLTNDLTSGGNETKAEAQNRTQSSTPSTSQSDPNINFQITNVSQDENRDLIVQTSIKGASSGNCKLKLSKGSKVFNKEAEVLFQPAFSTCKGFTIPFSEINSLGTWQLSLTLEVSGRQVATINKEIDVK